MSESLAWCLCSSHQLPLQQLPSLLARTRDGASQGHSALEQGSQDSQPPALVSQSASSPALPPPRAFLIFYISYSGMGGGYCGWRSCPSPCTVACPVVYFVLSANKVFIKKKSLFAPDPGKPLLPATASQRSVFQSLLPLLCVHDRTWRPQDRPSPAWWVDRK